MNLLKLIGGVLDIVQGTRWADSTATFTGVFKDKDDHKYDKVVPEGVTPHSYEIRYHTFEKGELSFWFIFDHGETPDPAALAGTTMKIKYDRNDPHFINVVD